MAADITLWRDLHLLTDRVCCQFGLRLPKLMPLTNLRARFYGDCDVNCGRAVPVIRIRVHQLHRPNRPLARSTILDTLSHEIAHLKVPAHGRSHREFTRQVRAFISV